MEFNEESPGIPNMSRSVNGKDWNIRIGLPTLRAIVYVYTRDILYCQGQSSQTSIYLLDGNRIVVSRTLKQCESILAQYDFCRIHKSYIINLDHIKEYHKAEIHSVLLVDGTMLEVSKTYRDLTKSKLNCL